MLKSPSLLPGSEQCVAQCRHLLSLIEPAVLQESLGESATIGAHLRHCIERFQCLLQGLQVGMVDYDLRPRNRYLEVDPVALDMAFKGLESQLRALDEESLQTIILVRESVHSQLAPARASSTVGRELMSLTSHTIHHLAIIALVIKPLGIELGTDFGKAPSTIRYELGQA